jgi:hypothetical protein
MTYGEGKPFHDRSGEKITHRLSKPGMIIIAKRLTIQIHRVSRGDGMAGFNRPLNYRLLGIA